MKQSEEKVYYENYQWFNRFLGDLRQLFYSIHNTLVSELSFTISNRGWYYEKSNHIPKIPPYWVTGISEPGFALQSFVVLDPSMLEAHPTFEPTLSLIFVKHPHSDKFLYINEYGLRIIKNNQITYRNDFDGFISGEIQGGEDPIPYHAFQVPLRVFTIGNDVQQAILDNVVSVIGKMPKFE